MRITMMLLLLAKVFHPLLTVPVTCKFIKQKLAGCHLIHQHLDKYPAAEGSECEICTGFNYHYEVLRY